MAKSSKKNMINMYFLTQYIIFKLVGNTTLLNYAKKNLIY